MKNDRKLAREQLDKWFRTSFSGSPTALRGPVKGWIRAIRYALGMSGRQLAERLGVSANSVSALEKREMSGAVTLRMMKRVGEAMDCTFFYGFRPNGSFEEIVRRRARNLLLEKIDRINQTMKLEGQELSKDEIEKMIEKEVERLIEGTPRSLWHHSPRLVIRKWK